MKRLFFAGSNNVSGGGSLRTLSLDAETGEISEVARVEDSDDALYLALSRDGGFLYAAENVAAHVPNCPPDATGGVSAFRVAPDGSLRRVASLALAKTVPCHVSLSGDGTRLYWAEYRNATFGIVALGADGAMKPLGSVHHGPDGKGPDPVRQEAAHCHWIREVPGGAGEFLVCDLGLDRVFSYRFDESEGTFTRTAGGARDYVAPAGHGPRHIAFLPGSRMAALVCELSSTVTTLDLGDDSKTIRSVCSRRMLPDDGRWATWRESKAAAIRVSPDGGWILASNRGHDSIAAFRLDRETGALEEAVISRLDGPFPRDFAFLPGAQGVAVVGHKLANEICCYRFDPSTGVFSRIPAPPFSKMTKPLAFAFAR